MKKKGSGVLAGLVGRLKDDINKRTSRDFNASPVMSYKSSSSLASPISTKPTLHSDHPSMQGTIDETPDTSVQSIETTSQPQFAFLNVFKNLIVDDPNQIKVKVNQKRRELGEVSLLQHIKPPQDSKSQIVAMRFSIDGKYLATTSQDTMLRVYIFSQNQLTLYRLFAGHTSPITDISWSKNNFLLSASLDNTVRCWHVTYASCLCAFKHPLAVTSVCFHPLDDRFFLSGCMDSRIRLWSLANKNVFQWNEINQKIPISSVAYNKDGTTVICGSANGDCIFFDADTLKYSTQISITPGLSKKTFRINGIEPVNDDFEDWILVTASDSRLRLYNLRDKSLVRKYKGK